MRKEQGKITRTSEITVNVLSMNEPISPDVFSLKGIDILKAGTPVEWNLTQDHPFPEGGMIWDGKDIVLEDRLAVALKEDGHFSPVRLAFILIGLALICWGVAVKMGKKV